MKKFLAAYWKTLLFFAVVGLVGGFFMGIYLLDSYPPELQQQLTDEIGKLGIGEIPAEMFLGLVTAAQAMGYGVVLGGIGILIGKKCGLWKDERLLERKPLVGAGIVAVMGGVGIIVPDLMFFGKYARPILDSYAVKPTVPYMAAAVMYGGVIEEVMLRLFAMSLVAWIGWKLFDKKSEKPSAAVLVAANIVSSLLFAAGHLPATAMLMGLTPMIVFRCFLLNGGLGLMFGRLYRKYGLRYAMLAHAGCHVISKLIWMLFV